MALTPARRSEQQDVRPPRQPSIAGRQRHHLSFRDHWDGLEVERGDRLAGGQTRLDEMPVDAAPARVGHLVLGERRKEAGRRPSLPCRIRTALSQEMGSESISPRLLAFSQFDPKSLCWFRPYDEGRYGWPCG